MGISEKRDDLDRELFLSRELLELALGPVEGELGHFEEDEPARRESQDLPAKLGADGPSGPRDRDAFTADAGPNELRVRRHRIAAQQIAHIQVVLLVDLRLAGD